MLVQYILRYYFYLQLKVILMAKKGWALTMTLCTSPSLTSRQQLLILLIRCRVALQIANYIYTSH